MYEPQFFDKFSPDEQDKLSDLAEQLRRDCTAPDAMTMEQLCICVWHANKIITMFEKNMPRNAYVLAKYLDFLSWATSIKYAWATRRIKQRH